ncbi:hypothetical protein F1559_004415 [Cyanidiococcus yangmingshanensis]|uniref:Homeobox domain-containing protein n=1 Tax=Cyanidiococcus yangmingshanensis TaxID=2690220 RepID=A0A7J7IQE9_9RHOD|nr:hypothetical protein F1559_004415 [Cyanidiococcus yangmingshanensis]
MLSGTSTCHTPSATATSADGEQAPVLPVNPAEEDVWLSPTSEQLAVRLGADDIEPVLFADSVPLVAASAAAPGHCSRSRRQPPNEALPVGPDGIVATDCSDAIPETEPMCIQRGQVRPCFSTASAATTQRRRAAVSASTASSTRNMHGLPSGRFRASNAAAATNESIMSRSQRLSRPGFVSETATWQPIRTSTAESSTRERLCSGSFGPPPSWAERPTRVYSRTGGERAWNAVAFSDAQSIRAHPQKASRKRTPLPKHAVALFEAWARAHWDHPYPSDAVKIQLSEQTGVAVKQVSNWFINFRKRSWNGRQPVHRHPALP